jgi:CheY-like chemotaxis protein
MKIALPTQYIVYRSIENPFLQVPLTIKKGITMVLNTSKKKSQKAENREVGIPDKSHEVQTMSGDGNKNRNIVVATYDSQFSDKMISYALEMAGRMSCGLIAVNCANLTHDITDFFSNAHDVAFEEFKNNSNRNAEAFGTKATEQGLRFVHTVNFSNIDNAVTAIIEEYGRLEFIITENHPNITGAEVGAKNFPTNRSLENINILLVDDNSKFLNALADRIRLQGYEPLTALNGKEALDIMHAKSVNLAIIDQRLPDLEGIDLISRLKEINPTANSTLLTGHGDAKLREATEALKSFYFEKEDMGSFWGFFKKILNSLLPTGEKEKPIAQTFCVYAID